MRSSLKCACLNAVKIALHGLYADMQINKGAANSLLFFKNLSNFKLQLFLLINITATFYNCMLLKKTLRLALVR